MNADLYITILDILFIKCLSCTLSYNKLSNRTVLQLILVVQIVFNSWMDGDTMEIDVNQQVEQYQFCK